MGSFWRISVRLSGWYLLLVGSLLLGCNKSETELLALDTGYEYYRLQVGKEYIYQVDSILFDEGTGGIIVDSVRTFYREVVADTLLDNNGNALYRMERYVRRRPEEPWVINKVWTAQRTVRQAYRTEDNLRFISLVFPPVAGASWNGTAFIDELTSVEVSGDPIQMFVGWVSRFTEVGQSLVLGDLTFPETVTVEVADFESTIGLRKGFEIYARDVGLVYREWQILDTQCRVCCGDTSSPLCFSLPWREKAEHGFILRQQLLSFR